MLPAAQRLRRREEFSTTVRRGRRASAPGIVVHLALAAGSGAPRAGFVVGRSVGPAVARNRVRRRLRHLISQRLTALPPGTALVVRATPAAAALTSADLGRRLDAALARLVPAPPC